jgi:basic membrane protein A and related proteins
MMVSTRGSKSNRLFILLVSLLAVITIFPLLSGCGAPSKPQNIINVGVILASGGLGDKSFNDSAYKGLLEAQKKYNIRFEMADFSDKESNLEALRSFARNNYDLVIGIAYENMDNIKTVAAEFPNVHFAGVDYELKGNNIESVVYREQEGDFLMGVLAAMLTRTKYVGVIGGTDIPAIRRIMSGFKQGVAYQDSSVKVFTDFAGTFSDPEIGLRLATNRYTEGADVIHNAASKTGLGIIQAAQQMNRWTTGTSGDQRYLAPGNMLGNRPKRIDNTLEMLIEEATHHQFSPGIRSLGLKENGIMTGPFDEVVVTPPMLNRLEELRQKIVNGQIIVQAE